SVGLIGAGACQDEHSRRMALKKYRCLFQQPALVFDGIDSADAQEHLSAANLRESGASGCPVILLIESQGNTVRLNEDKFGRMVLAQQRGFIGITGDDGIGIAEQTMGLKQKPEELAPLETACDRRVK